jgi:hypothetical protein
VAAPVAGPKKGAIIGAALARFAKAQSIYLMHVAGLVSPGREIPVCQAHQNTPEPVDNWTEDDLERMLDEGHRQLDRQVSDLERIRGRAQWLFTVSAAITVALGSSFVAKRPHGALLVLWLAGLVLVAYGVAGAAAVMTVRADFRTIDTAKLSQKQPPMLRYLAGAYSRMLATGENTVATRLTVFRQAVVFVIVGGYLGLLAVLLLHR